MCKGSAIQILTLHMLEIANIPEVPSKSACLDKVVAYLDSYMENSKNKVAVFKCDKLFGGLINR